MILDPYLFCIFSLYFVLSVLTLLLLTFVVFSCVTNPAVSFKTAADTATADLADKPQHSLILALVLTRFRTTQLFWPRTPLKH